MSSGSDSDDQCDYVGGLFREDYGYLVLKPDHELRPLWVSASGWIVLEAFSLICGEAQDFLTAVAEPMTRPMHMHEYRLTEYSLYAAVSVGISADSIIHMLDLLSKCSISHALKQFIRTHTASYGNAKVVLKDNRYWLETKSSDVSRLLMADDAIRSCIEDECVFDMDSMEDTVDDVVFELQQQGSASNEVQTIDDLLDLELLPQEVDSIDIGSKVKQIMDSAEPHGRIVWNSRVLAIKKDKIEVLKRRCADLSFPVLEEYDFHADLVNPPLQIDLKTFTKLRSYQEKGLSKLFGNGRARSGVIVLPCGAGKTLVGVTAACTVKKCCLVLCTSSVSVEQWSREFKHWSTIKDSDLGKFTSDSKQNFSSNAGVLISTYSMMTYSGKRAYDTQQLMDFVESREWGLILFDEVHVVPADMFRKVFTLVRAHAKLGLTATLVREDNKIDNLNYLIGPKLYEANWMELSRLGHIANVQCAEVRCNMTPEFFREYLRETSRRRCLLFTMNPRKLQACQYLINFHEAMGDKIIVFSDNIFALKHYSQKLNKPFIYGGTSQSERIRVLQQFRFNPALNTIFISKIGDTSIDLPEASCLIQISSHYGSRRQEAQRLGRILRAKKGITDGFNAFFYTLVSSDTEEMYFASKRQKFLIDQGYDFRIITHFEGIESCGDLAYTNLKDQLELLNTVLLATEIDIDDIESDEDLENLQTSTPPETEIALKRTSGTIASLSGADSMAYLEYNRGTTSGLEKHKRKKTIL